VPADHPGRVIAALLERPLTRRTVVGASAAATVTIIDLASTPASYPRDFDGYFTLGIASGDPSYDGVVLWTRLARDPLASDGLGALPLRNLPVHWEIASDPRMQRVTRRGIAIAGPASAHSVHVEVSGLRPGAEHYYRFRVGKELSPVGRALTAPVTGTRGRPLEMCFTSCANYAAGYFTVYRHLAEEHPDLVLHLGDYIYERGGPHQVRTHLPSHTARTLADYRVRHGQTRSDPDLQAAHRVAPWVVVWDDHDVENNYAGLTPPDPDEQDFPARRAAAYQAYYEHLPIRRARLGGPFRQMYRRIHWGSLATFHMLDTRQYRSDQACGGGVRDCSEAFAPRRAILGPTQERWLVDGLAQSLATWDVLGQQVFFAVRDLRAGAAVGYSMDAWDGYRTSRGRLLRAMGRLDGLNPVVLTGDVHKHFANDVIRGDQADGAPVAAELVTSSVTSGGDGSDLPADSRTLLAENPDIRFVSDRRGYVRTRLARDGLTAHFRVVPFVTTPGAGVSTRATFAVEAGHPGVRRVN
jgi:alkaline phosphatase D